MYLTMLLLAILFLFTTFCHATDKPVFSTPPSKILIWPTQHSHWFIMKILARSLSLKGHQVTVLHPTCFKHLVEEGEGYELVDYETGGKDVSMNVEGIQQYISKYAISTEEVSFFQKMNRLYQFSSIVGDRSGVCRYLLENKDLMEKLKREKYDIVLSDSVILGAEIFAAKLGIPHVSSTNLYPGEVHYIYAGAPIPLSYIPMLASGFSDKMNFLQRTMNTILYLVVNTWYTNYVFPSLYQPIVDKNLGSHIDWHDLMANTSLWLIRTDFAFEFPRPYTPNMKFVGGITARPGKPLTKEIEDIANASEDTGFIIFSFGSFVSSMHISKMNMFASAFSKLKQKVIWKYSGERPEKLGSNTKLVDWLPQNDLLAHPNCKLFITHGGNSGVYEGIYHGIPMLGFPLFLDQYDNLLRVQERGAGIIVEPSVLSNDQFLSTMQDLIYNTSYKENMMKLSKRHRDQPMSPLDSAVYWIEYVIRHKGAYHLRPANHELYWFQYYLLDVILFLLVIFLVVLYLNVKVFGLVWRQCKRVFKPAKKVKKN